MFNVCSNHVLFFNQFSVGISGALFTVSDSKFVTNNAMYRLYSAIRRIILVLAHVKIS